MIERLVDPADLAQAVEGLFSRCVRTEDGCLLVKTKTAQVRARGETLSGPRAVYTVKYGEVSLHDDVMRTCERKQCVEPTHLVKRPRGYYLEGARARHDAAARNRRRKYADEVVAKAFRYLNEGMTVRATASRLGIPFGTVAYFVRGRRRRRGTQSAPQCTRCDGVGHRRTNCPSVAEGAR